MADATGRSSFLKRIVRPISSIRPFLYFPLRYLKYDTLNFKRIYVSHKYILDRLGLRISIRAFSTREVLKPSSFYDGFDDSVNDSNVELSCSPCCWNDLYT